MFKLIQKTLVNDPRMLPDIHVIAMAALELYKYPERAQTHTVMLVCEMDSGQSGVRRHQIREILARWPSPGPNQIPRIFQLASVEVHLNEAITVSSQVAKCYDSIIEDLIKKGQMPDPNKLVFRIIWALKTATGDLFTSFVSTCGVFPRSGLEKIRQFISTYGEHPVVKLVNEFNSDILTEPELTTKMIAMTAKD
ncbi:hypothetical protein BD410DRAFT_134572 [Rickenella mellea]|uniref:Uncharacterized protein n=1 Tax=Rickenella mellea TaxID=50990 RepID=A0A4Y7Q8W3_9AGAM|nr:hypothetical protein BD410DRAFT_134572 [Rickenella mellea]